MPTILIFTANDPDLRLHRLADEANEIQTTLNSAWGKLYDVVNVAEASTREVVRQLNVPGRVVEVIHYAGHAGEDQLRLSDGDADAQALAEKIKGLGTVKLVFLNGCATEPQVRFFHEAGVPLVVATSRAIEDERAYEVAADFYLYLAQGRPVLQAFEEMQKDQKFIKDKVKLATVRAAGREGTGEAPTRFPWGLHLPEKEDEEADDNYSLPFNRPPLKAPDKVDHSLFLDKLIHALAAVESPSLEEVRKISDTLAKGGAPTETKKQTVLFQCLPSPLAIRLSQIFAEPGDREEYYRELLYDYVVLFETLLHLQASLLVAQIWGNKAISFAHQPKNLDVIHGFFRTDRRSASPADYMQALEALDAWVGNCGADSGVVLSAAQKAYLHSPDFGEACRFFFLQKKNFWQHLRLNNEESILNCMRAQEHLEKAFSAFSPLAKYQMCSVRGFGIQNMRYVEEWKFNEMASLLGQAPSYDSLGAQRLLENKSVLCFEGRELDPDQPYLNLFPLVFDRNVLVKNNPEDKVSLYLFMGYFEGKGEEASCYYFSSVDNPAKIWRFDESQSHISFTHLGDPAAGVHENNHFKVPAAEMKRYLTEFKKHFLNP